MFEYLTENWTLVGMMCSIGAMALFALGIFFVGYFQSSMDDLFKADLSEIGEDDTCNICSQSFKGAEIVVLDREQELAHFLCVKEQEGGC